MCNLQQRNLFLETPKRESAMRLLMSSNRFPFPPGHDRLFNCWRGGWNKGKAFSGYCSHTLYAFLFVFLRSSFHLLRAASSLLSRVDKVLFLPSGYPSFAVVASPSPDSLSLSLSLSPRLCAQGQPSQAFGYFSCLRCSQIPQCWSILSLSLLQR